MGQIGKSFPFLLALQAAYKCCNLYVFCSLLFEEEQQSMINTNTSFMYFRRKLMVKVLQNFQMIISKYTKNLEYVATDSMLKH